MLRRILLSLTLLLVTAYLVVALTAFNRKPEGQVCHSVELVVRDTARNGFISQKELVALLEKKGISPVGRKMDHILTRTLEEELSHHPLVDRVECYKTPSGKVCVEVTQRLPLLRVMPQSGDGYYVDNKGTVMPPQASCVAHLPVATGYIDRALATGALYDFASYLQQDAFWQAQIEQIHVLPDRQVELVPRVGDHIVYLGSLTDYRKKLDRVKEFYRKALNQVGWNKYKRINVEFDNQIICTKR